MDLLIRLVDGSVAHTLLLAPGSWMLNAECESGSCFPSPELEKNLGCWKLEVPCA
jgi:hypothetical protein